jgi:hypothetical protein
MKKLLTAEEKEVRGGVGVRRKLVKWPLAPGLPGDAADFTRSRGNRGESRHASTVTLCSSRADP